MIYIFQTHNAFTMCNEFRTSRSVSVSTETDSDDSDSDMTTNTLQQRLEKAEKDQARLQNEYNSLEKSFTDLLVRLSLCEEDSSKNSTDNRNASDFVLTNLKELEKEQEELRTNMAAVEGVCQQLNERIDSLCAENIEIKDLNDTLTRQNREARNETEKRVKEIELLRNEMNVCMGENKRCVLKSRANIKVTLIMTLDRSYFPLNRDRHVSCLLVKLTWIFISDNFYCGLFEEGVCTCIRY